MTEQRGDTPIPQVRPDPEPLPLAELTPGSELLVFRVGPERFALGIAGLEGVVDMPRLQPLPGMPIGMLGVAELRNSLVPVYSPERALNVALGAGTAALVVRVGGARAHGGARRIAIAVTAAEGVAIYDPVEWSGVGGPAPRAGLVRGVGTCEGQLTTLIDGATLVALCLAPTARLEA